MRVSELIDELLKIKLCRGDIEVVLHDSSCGYDFDDFSVYVDDGGADPDECIVGFDNDSDKQP